MPPPRRAPPSAHAHAVPRRARDSTRGRSRARDRQRCDARRQCLFAIAGADDGPDRSGGNEGAARRASATRKCARVAERAGHTRRVRRPAVPVLRAMGARRPAGARARLRTHGPAPDRVPRDGFRRAGLEQGARGGLRRGERGQVLAPHRPSVRESGSGEHRLDRRRTSRRDRRPGRRRRAPLPGGARIVGGRPRRERLDGPRTRRRNRIDAHLLRRTHRRTLRPVPITSLDAGALRPTLDRLLAA